MRPPTAIKKWFWDVPSQVQPREGLIHVYALLNHWNAVVQGHIEAIPHHF
jgi:hypothetical protein